MSARRWLEGLGRGTAGVTLVELLAATGLLAITAALAGGGTYQALSLERYWEARAMATKELRHAGSWFSSDALSAETTDLVDGGPPAGGVTLSWTAGDGTPHTVTYTLAGSALVRAADGASLEVARRVVSAGFSLSGAVLTFDLEVLDAMGGTRRWSLGTYLRSLRP